MKEIELLGINFTPLFEEYEPIRCLKCNCDVEMLKQYSLDDITIQDRILTIIPTMLELRKSKSGNEYYKLHFVDDYGSDKYAYIWMKEYEKFINNIIIGEPSILQLNVKMGSPTTQFIRLLKNIPQPIIENINFNITNTEQRIITKFLYDYIGGETEVWFKHFKAPFHIKVSYRLLKQLRLEGYKFELNRINEVFNIPDIIEYEDIICKKCGEEYYKCKCE